MSKKKNRVVKLKPDGFGVQHQEDITGLSDVELDKLSQNLKVDEDELREQFIEFLKEDVSDLAKGRVFTRGVVIVKMFEYRPSVEISMPVFMGMRQKQFARTTGRGEEPIFEMKSFRRRLYPIGKIIAIGDDCKSSVKSYNVGDIVEVSDRIMGTETNPEFERWVREKNNNEVGGIVGIDGAPPMVIKTADLYMENKINLDKFRLSYSDDVILRLGEELIVCNATEKYRDEYKY